MSDDQVEQLARRLLPGTAWWEPPNNFCHPDWPEEQRRAQESARQGARRMIDGIPPLAQPAAKA